jgi:hypothetical protein
MMTTQAFLNRTIWISLLVQGGEPSRFPSGEEGSSRQSREGGGAKNFPAPRTPQLQTTPAAAYGLVFPLLVQGGEFPVRSPTTSNIGSCS